MKFERWTVFAVLSSGVAASALALAAADRFDPDGLRMAIRFTARTSLALFCLAYAASSLRRLWPVTATSWLLRNRRYIGLSFAASHVAHGCAITALASTAPDVYRALTTPASYVFGGLGYLAIAAMAATSFDTTAAWLGAARWRRLHAICGFYLWAQFCISFGKRIPASPGYATFLAILFAVMALRLMARDPAAKMPQQAHGAN